MDPRAIVVEWYENAIRFLPNLVLIMIILLVLGVEILRRQTAREFPDAHSGNDAQPAD